MSDAGNQNDTSRRRWQLPRWLWVVLFASLALNLLVVGSIVGMRLAGHHGGPRGFHGPFSHIPKDQQSDIRALLRKHHDEVRPLRRALKDERRALVDYLREENVDKAELERRLDALETHHADLRKKIRPMILELVERLEPEARARMVKKFIGGPRGRHGRRHHKRRHD